jgi:hypothetical protein
MPSATTPLPCVASRTAVPTVSPAEPTAADAQEFQEAMRAYKESSGRMFPTWSEVLEVLRALGYEKTGE